MPALIKKFEDLSESVSMRILLAFALGDIGDKRAVPALIKALEDSDDEFLRSAIVEALEKIGDRSAVPALKESLLRDPDADVRRRSEEALKSMGEEVVPAVKPSGRTSGDACLTTFK